MAPLRLQSGYHPGMVALKNGLNGPKIAEFVLYTEHSQTTVPKQSIFNADHITTRKSWNPRAFRGLFQPLTSLVA
jgi:hypothetical protein